MSAHTTLSAMSDRGENQPFSGKIPYSKKIRGFEMEMDLSSIMGSASGAAIVVLLAKFYLQGIMQDLEDVVKAMHQIKEDLVRVTVKLDQIEKKDEIHDQKIASLLERVARAS